MRMFSGVRGESLLRASNIRAIAAFLLATLSLLWPAFVHGKPFLFADSSAYVRVVDAAVFKTLGHSTEWTRPGEVERLAKGSQLTAAPSRVAPSPSDPEKLDQNRVPLLGRSIYYGFLAYVSALTGQFWLLIAVQAIIVAAAILMFVAGTSTRGARKPLWCATLITLFLAATSTAPFFISFVMPDIFTGLAILSAAMLLFSPLRTRGLTLFWFLLACAAALFHSSHVLIIAALAGFGALITLAQRSREWSRVGLVLAASLAGVLGDVVFAKGVDYALGVPPVRPPFLTARLIDDGPGTRFLREHCDSKRFYACEFRERLPLHSDTFLWSSQPSEGVFNTLDPKGKRRLADEQGRFVREVVLAYPGQVLLSTAGSVTRQFGLMRLSEFRDIDLGRADAVEVPASAKIGLRKQGDLAPFVGIYADLSLIVAIIALMALPLLIRRKLVDGRIAGVIVAGVVVNAMVCGGLSTPHDRYGARVLWLVPLLAASSLGRLTPAPRNQARHPEPASL